MTGRRLSAIITTVGLLASLMVACSVLPQGESSVDNALSRAARLTTLQAESQTWTSSSGDSVSTSALVSGTNTLTITPISGSSDLSSWLSTGWAYDCVELDN